MLIHTTIDKLRYMRLNGMANSLEEQMQMQDIESLSFDERFGLMVDREALTEKTAGLRPDSKRPGSGRVSV